MRLLYGTGNPAKLRYMQKAVTGLGIELYGLDCFSEAVPPVSENGSTPLENARIKARAYYEAFRIPVFSCDTGLYFEHVPDAVQPGVHVRNVGGRYLQDDEMIAYYSGLAKQYHPLRGRYRNAICLILDEHTVIECADEALAGVPFQVAWQPHSRIISGFPIDSLALEIQSGRYYYDLEEEDNQYENDSEQRAFCEFFSKMIPLRACAE